MSDHPVIHKVERSALWTVCGVILLFSTAIIVTLIAPRFVDSTWTSPTSSYQVQMYEIEDPYLYVSSVATGGSDLQYVHHLKEGFTLLAFQESATVRIMADKALEKYVTPIGSPLKLTSRLLLLRPPGEEQLAAARNLQAQLQMEWAAQNPDWKAQGLVKIQYAILEIYDPGLKETFSIHAVGGSMENWVDENFVIVDNEMPQPYFSARGVVYVSNPSEYRVSPVQEGPTRRWRYDATGRPVKDVAELKSPGLDFHSRQELIQFGEHIYAIEGCWYCHTDQTRTLVQDVVLNGSDSYPAPPSSANEYIYQKITFPGTRRIGPDLSRVGVKRPSRDWHKSHFWSPKSASQGSIMPAFRHFFDDDPRGVGRSSAAIPNHQFEAIFQYLMTKGTRITSPTQAWWLGKDPIQTKEIIEGKKRLK